MNLPSGLAFFLDFKYGSSTAGFTANDNMYGNVSTAGSKMAVDEEVSGGLYGAGRFGYSINTASQAFTVDSGSVTSKPLLCFIFGTSKPGRKSYVFIRFFPDPFFCLHIQIPPVEYILRL